MESARPWTMEYWKGLGGRDAYGKTIADLGEEYENLVLLNADVVDSTRGSEFMRRFPERTFNFGIAEANMISAAAGFAIMGKIPIVASYAFLLCLRAAEQVRTDVCYPNWNVKLVATATGLAMGTGGPTHHCNEDLAIMRSFANLTIICPGSPMETVFATRAAIVGHRGPVYLRLVRGGFYGEAEEIYDSEESIKFSIGKASTLKDGEHLAIIATGQPLGIALRVANRLNKEKGIRCRVVNMSTIKPLDEEVINRAAKETGGIITIEEHSIIGGLGEAVCSVVCQNRHPIRVLRIGIKDEFCEIGETNDLWRHHGLSEDAVIAAATTLLE